ncbi:MAG: carbon-nitrogen hydrolase family protein [Eubacteriaceae bacterium]|nr:carbon-nitrogen hydrolase family protein [Eubacteriaceae bacterium]
MNLHVNSENELILNALLEAQVILPIEIASDGKHYKKIKIEAFTPDTIPGAITDYFSTIAKNHHIYFIPGTMYEVDRELPEGRFYNTAIVFNPDGEIIGKYRKMAPWRPGEDAAEPGREYLVFDIPEKNTKIGVQICYDLNFPEISRNETLMGAEVLVKLTMDPEELFKLNQHIHYARALENQAYMVCTNGTGYFNSTHLYGHSQVITPEGNCVWEAEQEDAICTVTLDLDLVYRCRKYGTIFMDHYLKHLFEYDFPMPYADDFKKAPLYKQLGIGPANSEAYDENVRDIGGVSIGKRVHADIDLKCLQKNLDDFLR